MIILTEKEETIYLPKLERCKLDACNLYYLLLHNNYTKVLWVFKVRDIYANLNPLRFTICFKVPECEEGRAPFDEGEYTYYLISYDDFNIDKLSTNYPDRSQIVTDKEAFTYNGLYLVSGDKMLVYSGFKAKVKACDKEIKYGDSLLIATKKSEDKKAEGKIVTEVSVLNSGLLKYQLNKKICCNNYIEYEGGEQSKFKQYEG